MEKNEKENQSTVLEPIVKAVLVADERTLWLEEVIDGLAAQDYKKIEFLLILTSKEKANSDVEDLIKRVFPDSKIVRTSNTTNYALLANLVLRDDFTEFRESFFLFLKDDVILDATCVRRMVELAVGSNAGIVGPKVLDRENPSQLEDMGSMLDNFYSPVGRSEKGENDQGQHDGKEISATPESVILIRADLFRAIEGYDKEVNSPDNNVEICLRSHLVGAKIVSASNSVATRFKSQPEFAKKNLDVLRPRHRLRMALAGNFGASLTRSIFESFLIMTSGVVYGLVTGRFSLTWGHLSSFWWNLKRLESLNSIRGRIRKNYAANNRNMVSSEPQQHSFRRAVIGQAPSGTGPEALTRIRFHQLWSALLGPGGIALLIAGVILGFGSRHLLSEGLPAIGRFQLLPPDPLDLFRSWWYGWRSTATGMETLGPDGVSVLGVVLAVLPGDDQLLWSWMVVAAIPIGAIGVWRLVRPIGGGRSRAVAFLVYLSVPLPYDALREGRLTPLAIYALLPWLAKRMAVSQGVSPYGSIAGEPGPGIKERTLLTDGLLTGLLLALGIALDPVFLVPVLTIFLGLVVGSLLSGKIIGVNRLLKSFCLSMGVASLLHFPLLIDLLTGRSASSLIGFEAWRKGTLGPSGIFNLNTGSFTHSSFTWVLLIVAAFALLVGTEKHLFLGIRSWLIMIFGFFAIWLVDQGWWPGRTPEEETLFVPVAVGLAWASAIATAGMGSDLTDPTPKKLYLRRVSIGIAALSLGVSSLPVLLGSLDGSWGSPRKELSSVLSFVVDESPAKGEVSRGGENRIVWIGEPSILPATASVFTEDVGIAITDGLPDITDQWPYQLGANKGALEIRKGIAKAIAGDTNRLGEILGKWGVKHLILVEGLAPVPYEERRFYLPSFYEAALTRQLDLARTEGLNSAVTIFENTAHEAVHAVVRDSNRKVVPAEVERISWGEYLVASNADGAFRWMLEPVGSWKLYNNGSENSILRAGDERGVPTRRSVRVASETISILQLDGTASKARHRLQIALLIIVLLGTNWSRLRSEEVE